MKRPHPSHPPHALLLLALALAAVAAESRAQKMPLGPGDARLVQLHDVRDLLAKTHPQGPDADSAENAERRRQRVERLEEFVRTFVTPPLTDDDDVQALGPDHLVMLARPEQQAWLEQLLAHHRGAAPYHITLEIRILTVPKAAFAQHFAPLFDVEDTWQRLQTVRDPGAATDKWRAAVVSDPRVESLQAPRLLAAPLQGATIHVGDTIRYVKDYQIEAVRGRSVAVPIMSETFDGVRIAMTSGLVAEDRLGVTFDFHLNDLKEMPKWETKLDGISEKVTVDLPSWTQIRLEQRLILPDGGTAIVSAPNNDSYAVAVVTARTQPL